MKKAILFILLLICLSGCAAIFTAGKSEPGTLIGEVPQVENNNFAIVHILRKAGHVGCKERWRLQIDDRDFYLLACGERIAFKAPAGKDIKISQVTTPIPDHLYLEPEKGKNYYIAGDCFFNYFFIWCKFMDTNKSWYMDWAKDCGKEIPIGYTAEVQNTPDQGRIKTSLDTKLQTAPSSQASSPTLIKASPKAKEYVCWGLGVIVKTDQKITITDFIKEGNRSAKEFLKVGDEIIKVGKDYLDPENAYKILTRPIEVEADDLVPVIVRRESKDITYRIRPNW